MAKRSSANNVVSLNELQLDQSNVRKHGDRNKKVIASSLKRFGAWRSIAITADNRIVAGNGTVMMAKESGVIDEVLIVEPKPNQIVAVRRTDLSNTEATAYAIADNRASDLADWDQEALTLQLNSLRNDNFNIDDVGYSDAELDRLIKKAGDELISMSVEPEPPPPPAEPVTKPGDVWQLGAHLLLCGDSTDQATVDNFLKPTRVSFGFTSPPYNLGDTYKLRKTNLRKSAYTSSDDDNGDWYGMMDAFITNALDHCPSLCVNVQLLAGNKIDLLKLLGNYATRIADIAVWTKPNPQPAAADGVMNSAFEFLIFFANEENPSRRLSGASFDKGMFSNVIELPNMGGHQFHEVHGAVFPLHLATSYLKNCSPEQSVVYEPFSGTGTTIMAAEATSRACYAIEINPQYCDVAVKRWEEATGKKAVLVT